MSKRSAGTDKNPPMALLTPATIDDALAALADRPGAHVLAGGTDFMVEVNFGHRRPDDVVSLGRVAELRRWRVEGETIRLGAGVTCTQLMQPRARRPPAGPGAGRPHCGVAADPQRREHRRQPRHGVAGG